MSTPGICQPTEPSGARVRVAAVVPPMSVPQSRLQLALAFDDTATVDFERARRALDESGVHGDWR